MHVSVLGGQASICAILLMNLTWFKVGNIPHEIAGESNPGQVADHQRRRAPYWLSYIPIPCFSQSISSSQAFVIVVLLPSPYFTDIAQFVSELRTWITSQTSCTKRGRRWSYQSLPPHCAKSRVGDSLLFTRQAHYWMICCRIWRTQVGGQIVHFHWGLFNGLSVVAELFKNYKLCYWSTQISANSPSRGIIFMTDWPNICFPLVCIICS